LACSPPPLLPCPLQLERFLDKRNTAWQRLVGQGAIPAWLVSLVHMAQALPAAAQPDYQASDGCGWWALELLL